MIFSKFLHISFLGKNTLYFIFLPIMNVKDQSPTKLGFSLVKNLGKSLEKKIHVVYFDQGMGTSHTVHWSKSSFLALKANIKFPPQLLYHLLASGHHL